MRKRDFFAHRYAGCAVMPQQPVCGQYLVWASAVSCTRPSAVTATEYGTITETDLTAASFAVTLACNAGYASAGTPTATQCTSAGDYTVTDQCTGASPSAV